MPVTIDGVDYFPAAEVMESLRVSRATLWRWRNNGKVPPGHRLRGRQVVFTRDEVEAIRNYAHRLEPISPEAAEQLPLFGRGGRR